MVERICKKCKKVFIPTYQWVYKDECNVYCSWTCYNHRNDGAKSKWRKVKKIELYNKDGCLLNVFASATNAATQTGYDANRIRNACCRQKPYYGFIWKYRE